MRTTLEKLPTAPSPEPEVVVNGPYIRVLVRFGGMPHSGDFHPSTTVAEVHEHFREIMNIPPIAPVAVGGKLAAGTSTVGELAGTGPGPLEVTFGQKTHEKGQHLSV